MASGQDDPQEEIPAGLEQNVGFLLNKAARILRDDMGASLRPLALSLYEYVVMRMLETGIADTQQAIGQRIDIDRSSMVSLVDRLEERQLLTREVNQQDRRSYRLILTPRGRKTLSRAKRIASQVHKRFLAPLSADEWAFLQSCLRKLITRKAAQG